MEKAKPLSLSDTGQQGPEWKITTTAVVINLRFHSLLFFQGLEAVELSPPGTSREWWLSETSSSSELPWAAATSLSLPQLASFGST